jgi:hypothetical protein
MAAIAWDGGHGYHILTLPNTHWFLPNADGPAISRADNLKAHQLLSFLHIAVGNNISEHSLSSPAHHHLSITTTNDLTFLHTLPRDKSGAIGFRSVV